MADTQTTRESTNPNPMAGTVSSDPAQGTAWPVTLAPSAAVLTRATIRGTFSLIGDDPVGIEAEAGLVIRVHAGRVQLPPREERPGVVVAAGEHVVVPCAGSLTVRASKRTQIELDWPVARRWRGSAPGARPGGTPGRSVGLGGRTAA